jgi:diguanylate cyclase (GGDEF)-like protein
MRRIIDYLATLPKWQVLGTAIILVAFFGVVDYITGPDLSIFVLYLIPVFLGTWFIGNSAGILLSIFSALAWSLADRIYADAIIPYWNLSVEVCSFLLMTYVLSVLKQSLDNEKQLASTDDLTGTFNRRHFIELAETEMNRAQRYQHPFSVAYLDVDNFKTINDTLGHHAGDSLLRRMADTIRQDTRTTDIVARLGGDEFIILFPETGFDTVRSAVEKIKDRLAEIMQEHRWPVTFSFGVVTFEEPPASIDQMIKVADSLMYDVKNNGKNGIRSAIFSRQKAVL